MEFMEETLKIMSYLTFYGQTISPAMWNLFPLLYQAFEGWACDWMDRTAIILHMLIGIDTLVANAFGIEMLIPLDNYISRGNEIFISNPEYLKMILSMYQKVRP